MQADGESDANDCNVLESGYFIGKGLISTSFLRDIIVSLQDEWTPVAVTMKVPTPSVNLDLDKINGSKFPSGAPVRTARSTVAEGVFLIRSLSPVAEDSSNFKPYPEMSIPSTGIISPGSTCNTSPV